MVYEGSTGLWGQLEMLKKCYLLSLNILNMTQSFEKTWCCNPQNLLHLLKYCVCVSILVFSYMLLYLTFTTGRYNTRTTLDFFLWRAAI